MRNFVSALALITLLSGPVMAQEKELTKDDVKKEEAAPTKEVKKETEKKEAASKKTEAKPAAKKEEKPQSVVKASKQDAAKNTPLQKWIDAENALIDPLSDKDKESFFILRNKHSVIRTIDVVERDIGNAVKACGEKNPGMKDKMNTRFSEWKGSVEPIIDTAKKTLNKDIENQKIVDAKKAKNVLKLNDEAFEYGEKQIVKQPVTTEEACEGLIASMDRTEDDMIKLLQETLLPESVIKKRAEETKKAK